MPARLIPIGILLLLVTACGSTEFVSPLDSPLATPPPTLTQLPSPLETPTPEPVPTTMPIGAVIVSPVYGSVVQGQVKIIGTAAFHMDALWSPDGTGAIIQDRSSSPDRMLWYVPTDGSPLTDLRPVMEKAISGHAALCGRDKPSVA